MDFGFTPEQNQLRDQAARFLETECPLDRVRAFSDSSDPLDAELWGKIAEMGWPALVVPEDFGGLGLPWETLIVLAEEHGRSLCPSPLLGHAAACRAIDHLGSDAQKASLLPDLAAGTRIAALAFQERSDVVDAAGIATKAVSAGEGYRIDGEKLFVQWGGAADVLIVTAILDRELACFAVPANASGVDRTQLELVDGSVRAAKIALSGVQVAADARLGSGDVTSKVEAIIDAAVVAASAEMAGAADAAVKLAAEYAKVREQFGRPIGQFQGVKHTLAELHVGAESSKSLAYYASWAVDNDPEPRAHVSMAKAFASDAVDRAGEECVQLHGAIGYTWECDAHLFYKRGRYAKNVWGAADLHNERLLASRGL